ncbi:MAG TPA: hypothetical protein VK206_06915 [Anaerolineales bacterium]|nr:hypothetical protein [Anaerolineales bacterium]HLO28070.1 hypothetical protein [Anaerolineales bacterium]
MKRILFYLLILFFAFSRYTVQPALAQVQTPPAGPVGEVRGTVINTNTGKVVTESLEVMLHVLDLDLVDKDMKHGQSQADGTFVFSGVPFDANTRFAVMATFDGVTYYSNTLPADMTSMQVSIDVPVYETTTDLASVQIDQMHVLFDFSPDGLETKELYIISNTGEQTVKDVYDLGGDKFAALEFPLPKDADYIFFKPDDQDRFIKLSGAFGDTYPILPGNQPSQVMTSYLVPYSGERAYAYTAPVNTARINFLLPDQADVSLKGSGLTGPESMTLQDGVSYKVYSYSDLKAGDTLSVTITGTTTGTESNKKTKNKIAVGVGILGLAIIGTGVWWLRRSKSAEDEEDEVSDQPQEPTLDELIAEIARLDDSYEQEGLGSDEHQRQRRELMQRAKQLL